MPRLPVVVAALAALTISGCAAGAPSELEADEVSVEIVEPIPGEVAEPLTAAADAMLVGPTVHGKPVDPFRQQLKRARNKAERTRAREQQKRKEERAERKRLEAEAERRTSGGLVIGDSVALGAKSCLAPLGYRVVAEVGATFAEGWQELREQTQIPGTVVVHLGTNGPFSASEFDQVMSFLGDRHVIWVDISLPAQSQYSFVDSLNQMIAGKVASYQNAKLARFSDAPPSWFYDDQVHLNSAGCAGFTKVVDDAVTSP